MYQMYMESKTLVRSKANIYKEIARKSPFLEQMSSTITPCGIRQNYRQEIIFITKKAEMHFVHFSFIVTNNVCNGILSVFIESWMISI